ncbi:MAG TPA: FHA domain-containing protein [Vicinamibacteria bacterium]|jgi:pSer/pThr/pTyr-binding forkhead associated (FHA) protein|nr:FHA domain-containing protein [Vicinamibacteria bacterium]
MANLRLIGETGTELEFTLDRTLVGREATCDVVVEDKSVSRKHAVIEHRGEGWTVVDQGSANGTFVNGQKVAEAELHDGHELRLGMVNFRVEIEAGLMGTVLMTTPETSGTVLMTTPEISPPPRAPAPAPVRAAAPPLPGPVRSGPASSAAPPAPARNAEDEAADVLGVHAGASPYEIKERYEELSRDLQLKLANAKTPVLKSTYEKNLASLSKAFHVLSPEASPLDHLADLPSAQPVVDPDLLESEERRAEVEVPPLPEAAHAKGASVLPPATSVFVFAATGFIALFAFFSLSAGKNRTAIKKMEEGSELQNLRQAAAKYEMAGLLQKNGALRNGKLKLCNKSGSSLAINWLGAMYVAKDDLPGIADRKLAEEASGYKLTTYNSQFCGRDFKLVLEPGAERVVELSSQEPRCAFDGSALVYAFSLRRPAAAAPEAPSEEKAPRKAKKGGGASEQAEKKPGDPGTQTWLSGLTYGRQECVNIGVGW